MKNQETEIQLTLFNSYEETRDRDTVKNVARMRHKIHPNDILTKRERYSSV